MAKAKKSADAGEVKLVRKHKESGAVSARSRGRRHPDFEYGYLDAAGDFQAGDPPKRRGRKRRAGRPVGSGRKPGRPAGSTNARANGLSEIEQIVRREVETRLKRAKAAALAAFDSALGV
jgi:hypothetical protein